MMFTVETNFAVRNGIMYGVAKITGPRGVRTIAVHAPMPKNTGITISGSDEVGWFGEDIWKGAKKAVKGAAKGVSSAAKSVAKNPLKAASSMALGGLNLHWVADSVARKIPGYHAVTDKFGITKYADAMHNVGKMSFNDLKKLKLTKKQVASKLGEAVNDAIKQEVGVSIPVSKASAAFVTAQSVLKSAANAEKYVAAAKATMGALHRDPASAVKAGGLAGRLISAGMRRGGAKGVEAVLTEVQTKARAGLHAKKIIAETIRRSQAGDPVAKRFLSTLAIAKKADNKLNAIKKVVAVSRERKGLLVLPNGEILRGTFGTAGATRL